MDHAEPPNTLRRPLKSAVAQRQSVSRTTMSEPSGYIPVIGAAHFWPLVALFEQLDALADKTVNEVQASEPHNGFAVAVVTLCVFLIESTAGRAKYLAGLPPSKPIDYLTSVLPNDLAQEVEELFVVRDVIAHNHLWDAEVQFADGTLKLRSAKLRDGYGDNKFRRNVNLSTRKTKRLGLNAFPTRISYNDAVLSIRTTLQCLTKLDGVDGHVIRVEGRAVKYHGVMMMFDEFVRHLQLVPEVG
jgi:hypothetical protein